MQKGVSSFSAIYIAGGLCYIVFLLYYIGMEMKRVHTSELIYLEKVQELDDLKNARDRVAIKKDIMTTDEHADRRKKENFGELNSGEIEFILPQAFFDEQEEVPMLFTPENKAIEEQWRDLFFPNT